MVWLLLWFHVVPEQGVRYHHLGTYNNETICNVELKKASVLVNDKLEAIECVGVKVND